MSNSTSTDNKDKLTKAVKETLNLYTTEKVVEAPEQSKPEVVKPEKEYKVPVGAKAIQAKVKKEKVNQLVNLSKEDKNQIFEVGKSKFTEAQKTTLLKKMNKWEASEEINTANAAVVVSLMDKIQKKLK